jgi:hypothetical protein
MRSIVIPTSFIERRQRDEALRYSASGVLAPRQTPISCSARIEFLAKLKMNLRAHLKTRH